MSKEKDKIQTTNPNADAENGTNEVKEPKKPGAMKRAWAKVKSTAKAIKDNPVASAVCTIAGALATVGVGIFLESRKQNSYIELPQPESCEDEPEAMDVPAEEAEE